MEMEYYTTPCIGTVELDHVSTLASSYREGGSLFDAAQAEDGLFSYWRDDL